MGALVDSPAAAGIPLQVTAPDAQFDALPEATRAGRVRGPATRSRMSARGEAVVGGIGDSDGISQSASWGSSRRASSSLALRRQ